MQSAQQPPDPGPAGIDAAGVPGQRAAPDHTAPDQAAPGAAQPAGSLPPDQQTEPHQSVKVPAQRSAPGQPAAEQVAPTPVLTPRRRLRPVLTVLGGMLALLLLGGVGIAYVAYDSATAPDRSAPDVVVDNFLRAYLVDRDDAQTNLYVCEGGAGLAQIRGLRDEAERREAEFHVVVRISWGSLDVVETGRGKTVRTELTVASLANGQVRGSRRETWEFEVVNQDGWRVCGASRLG